MKFIIFRVKERKISFVADLFVFYFSKFTMSNEIKSFFFPTSLVAPPPLANVSLLEIKLEDFSVYGSS